MSRFVDSIIAYRILQMLVTPFDKTDAFRLGIIDKNGKELKPMTQLNTVQEKDAYSILHRLVYRLKRIIEKVPIENKKLVSLAAAYSLIREHYDVKKEPIDFEKMYLSRLNTNLKEEIALIQNFNNNKYMKTFKQFSEEGLPANNAGTPGIAGLPPDDPPVSAKASSKYKKKNKINLITPMFRRKS